jgi:hypothetical protein
MLEKSKLLYEYPYATDWLFQSMSRPIGNTGMYAPEYTGITLPVTCFPLASNRYSTLLELPLFPNTATVFPSGPCDGHAHLVSSFPFVVSWSFFDPSGDDTTRLLFSM